MLELAILGLLHDSPIHGYELRKRLNPVIGTVRTLSYGTLYPRLRDMVEQGWIAEVDPSTAPTPNTAITPTRRARVTYALTPDGKERFGQLLDQAGPAAWEDGQFSAHFMFFDRTTTDVRLRILEGRRARLEERLAQVRESPGWLGNAYSRELRRHELETAEREVHWLISLIAAERDARPRGSEGGRGGAGGAPADFAPPGEPRAGPQHESDPPPEAPR